MGNPLYSDEEGQMCYNPAKSWQIGWYKDSVSILDITQSSVNHVQTIIGVANYGNNDAGMDVVIKLETGTSTDYFVGFNRATGITAQNDEADDEVTIIETGSNGESYSQSFLKVTLRQGESYTVQNQEVLVTVESIDISTDPGTARISFKKGSGPVISPTNPPVTKPPVREPVTKPVREPSAPTSDRDCLVQCCYPVDANGNGGSANNYMLNICATQGCHYEWTSYGPRCQGKNYYNDCVEDTCTGQTSQPTHASTEKPTTKPVTKTPVREPVTRPVREPSAPTSDRDCLIQCCFPVNANGNGGSANDLQLFICATQGCHYEFTVNGASCSGKNYYNDCVEDTCTG